MELLASITQLASRFREFVAPVYRPELHYMRGPGPAYARRMSKFDPTATKPAAWTKIRDSAP